MIRGRDFLAPAASLASGPTEAHWRAAAGRAYYALFQESLSALRRWGVRAPSRENVHAFVRLRFSYASDSEARAIGKDLDHLVILRNEADYQLDVTQSFRTSGEATRAIARSRAAIALLDSIEADPARLAAVTAAIRP